MKYRAYIPLAAIGVILAGCDRSQPAATTAESTPPSTNSTATTLTDKAGATADAALKQLAETREEAVRAMTEHLATWEAKVESLQTKAKEGGSDTIAALRRELDQAGTYLKEAGAAGKDQWQELKSKFDETMDRLSAAYDAAAKELQSDS